MHKFVNWTLDLLWALTEPLAGTCPVCAFWRGITFGLLAALAVVLLHGSAQ